VHRLSHLFISQFADNDAARTHTWVSHRKAFFLWGAKNLNMSPPAFILQLDSLRAFSYLRFSAAPAGGAVERWVWTSEFVAGRTFKGRVLRALQAAQYAGPDTYEHCVFSQGPFMLRSILG
jgi:hypothetical protein